MDPQVKHELEVIHGLVRENHDMLRAIRRDQWFRLFVHVLFYLVIILGAAYIVQKYVIPYSSSLPSPSVFQQLLNQYHSTATTK